MSENVVTANDDEIFDPFAPGFTDDPYPQYQRLRETGPVHRHPLGFWLLTQYAEVSDLLRSGLWRRRPQPRPEPHARPMGAGRHRGGPAGRRTVHAGP
jgi:cytochrome P450